MEECQDIRPVVRVCVELRRVTQASKISGIEKKNCSTRFFISGVAAPARIGGKSGGWLWIMISLMEEVSSVSDKISYRTQRPPKYSGLFPACPATFCA